MKPIVLRVGDIVHRPIIASLTAESFLGKQVLVPSGESCPACGKKHRKPQWVRVPPAPEMNTEQEDILVTAVNIDALCKELGMVKDV